MEENIIYIDSENLAKIVEVLNVYIKEENEIIDNIKERYTSIKQAYKSNNNELLEQLEINNISNLNKTKNNHDSNIFLINARIEHVIESVKKSKEIDDSVKIDRIVKHE